MYIPAIFLAMLSKHFIKLAVDSKVNISFGTILTSFGHRGYDFKERLKKFEVYNIHT